MNALEQTDIRAKTDPPPGKKNRKTGTHFRRVKWLFSRSGVLALAFEHFLAMVPATILVPIMVNNSVGSAVIDMSLVLLSSGVGTILFTIFTKGKIPGYLGSSFAYIGLTIYLVEEFTGDGIFPDLAYIYVGWAYIFSGALLFLLSFLYKKRQIDKILSFLLPASVVGPAISLIGLELADTAIVDSGFDVVNGMVDGKSAVVAIVTLGMIVLFSLMRRRKWKNAAIIIGMIAGYIVYLFLNGAPEIDLGNIQWITCPKFQLPIAYFPENPLGLFIAVVPATFIVFTENIGRVTVINRMVNETDYAGTLFNSASVKSMEKGLRAHGIASMAAALIGSVPNTIYAENIAVMGIHRTNNGKKDPDKVIENMTYPFSPFPYILASLIAIVFSFVGVLQTVLLGIPKCVIGGMEMFLFGIISAPGIQLLVDQRVNYGKVSNQIITAAVLISGCSGISVDLGVVDLKGMTLGFVVGIVLNLIVQFLKWLGILSDAISFDELMSACLNPLPRHGEDFRILDVQTKVAFQLNTEDGNSESIESVSIPDLHRALDGTGGQYQNKSHEIQADVICDIIRHATLLSIGLSDLIPLIRFRKTANGMFVEFRKEALPEDLVQIYLNDYPEAIDTDAASGTEFLCVDVAQSIPMRKIQRLVTAIAPK